MNLSSLNRIPELNFGMGITQNLGPKVKHQLKANRVLILTDQGVMKAGITAKIEKTLKEAQVEYEIYADVEAEPAIESLTEVTEVAINGNFDALLGVGGGSVMDVTKITAAFMTNPNCEIKDFFGIEKVPCQAAPTVLVATTSGTGSEVTRFAVLADAKRKYAVNSHNIMGTIAYVDPELTLSLPQSITAATGIDAFVHAVEAYIAVGGNPFTDNLALQAINLIAKNLIPAVNNGNDPLVRYNMSLGSLLAGIVLNNAGTGIVHALAYPVAGEFHVSHGISNVVNFAHILEYIAPAIPERFAKMAEAMGENISGLPTYQAASLFTKSVRHLCQETSLPIRLRDIGADPSIIPILTETAIGDKRLFGNTLYQFTDEDIFKIYSNAY